MNIFEKKGVQIGVGAGLGLLAGAGAGYLAATKILEKKFEIQLDEEIQKAKVFYQEMYSTPVFEADSPTDAELLEDVKDATDAFDGPPEDLVGNALSAVSSYDPTAAEEAREEEARTTPPQARNIFMDATPPGEEVLDALMADRDPSKPYIITKVEFLEGIDEFEQIPYTYWEKDDVLVDDRDEYNPIDNIKLVVGEDNLLRFGYGSGDMNVLYVRNEAAEPPFDLHITKSSGKYAEEVMGLGEEDDSPQLAHMRDRPRKFKLHDD